MARDLFAEIGGGRDLFALPDVPKPKPGGLGIGNALQMGVDVGEQVAEVEDTTRTSAFFKNDPLLNIPQTRQTAARNSAIDTTQQSLLGPSPVATAQRQAERDATLTPTELAIERNQRRSDSKKIDQAFGEVQAKQIASQPKYQSFGAALLAGIDDTQKLVGAGVEATAEVLGGRSGKYSNEQGVLDAFAEYGRETREQNTQEADQYGRRGKFADITSVGDAFAWATQTAGNMIPVMVPAIVGGAVGTAAAPAVGVTATIGGVVGAFIPSVVVSTGEVQANAKDKDPNKTANGWTFAGGTAIAALDSILPGRIGAKLVGKFGREGAEEIALRALLRPAGAKLLAETAKSALKEGTKQSAIEGLTESVQEAIGEVTASLASESKIDWKGLPSAMLESGAAGALMGAGTGSVTGGAETYNEMSAENRVYRDGINASAVNRQAPYSPGEIAVPTSRLPEYGPARPVAAGKREQATATVKVKQTDVNSPYDTETIVTGRTAVADAMAMQEADKILNAAGMPATGRRVAVTMPDGTVKTGVVEDAFDEDVEGERATGINIRFEDGFAMRQHFDTLADAGVSVAAIGPRTAADIDAELAARAAQTVPAAGTAPDPVAVAPQPQGRKGSGVPVDNAKAITEELFPGVRVTSWERDADDPLTKKNPNSWHAKSRAAVDVAPIQGMTFDQFVQRYKDAGYTILEVINETGKGKTAHATGDHWHIVLGQGGGTDATLSANGDQADTAGGIFGGELDAPMRGINEGAPDPTATVDAQSPAGGLRLFHGSPNKDLSLDDVTIIGGEGRKQGKNGRSYGGFYAAGEDRISDAQGYAGEGGSVYQIDLKPNAVVEEKSGDITRLSEQTINEYRGRGVDVVVGKDPRGRTEYAIINKDAIQRFAQQQSAEATTDQNAVVAKTPEELGREDAQRNFKGGAPDVFTPEQRAEWQRGFNAQAQSNGQASSPLNDVAAPTAGAAIPQNEFFTGNQPRVRGTRQKPIRRGGGFGTFLEYVTDIGGVRDDEGNNLAGMRGLQQGIAGAGSLIRKNGLSIDQIGERAFEDGWFNERPTTTQVLELLDKAQFQKIYNPLEDVDRRQEDGARAQDDLSDKLQSIATDFGGDLNEEELRYAVSKIASDGFGSEAAVMSAIEWSAAQRRPAYLEANRDNDYGIPFDGEALNDEQIREVDRVLSQGSERPDSQQGNARRGEEAQQAPAGGSQPQSGGDSQPEIADSAPAAKADADKQDILAVVDANNQVKNVRKSTAEREAFRQGAANELGVEAKSAFKYDAKNALQRLAFENGRKAAGAELKARTRRSEASAKNDDTASPQADIEVAVAEVDTNPTDAQKEAGNYRKGHVTVQGLNITIENPKGSERSGKDPNGKAWSVSMPAHYGYVKGSKGADGEQVDVYIGDEPESRRVFIVDQNDADTGKFDEHKVMLGFADMESAEETYRAGFSDGKGGQRIGGMTEMSINEFKGWLEEEQTAPVAAPTTTVKENLTNAGSVELVYYGKGGKVETRTLVPSVLRTQDTLGGKNDDVYTAADVGGLTEGMVNSIKRISEDTASQATILDAIDRGIIRDGDMLMTASPRWALESGYADIGPVGAQRRGRITETGKARLAQLRGDTAPEAQPDTKIEDFGERLEGARKFYAEAFGDKIKDATKLDVASAPLSQTWPEPDYQKLLDDGADEYVVAAMRAMRDAVPIKPKRYGLGAWVKQTEMLRGLAMDMLQDGGMSDKFKDKLEGDFKRALGDLQGSIDLYREFGHAQSFKGISFGSHFYSVYRGEKNVTKWSITKKAKASAYSNWPRELAVADTRDEVIAKFRAMLKSGDLSKKKNDVIRFDIYSYRNKPGFYIGKKVGKDHIDLRQFDTATAARAFKTSEDGYAELVNELQKMKFIPNERKEANAPRIGINHRNGADVTTEQFAEAFGFRGVQFGNYVEGPRRQQDLNEAFDALMDMAGILGIQPKAISLNGTLGLSFGARGKGGKNPAKAHYEPGNVVINLTKSAGAGSLAHEWWHSLDNYFGTKRGVSPYVTDATARPETGGMRPEMLQAFGDIMAALRGTALKERSRQLDKLRSKEYWSTDIEMSARAFESYVISKLQDEQFSNDYLANIIPETAFGRENGYPYPTAAEIDVVRAGFDKFFETIESRETKSGVELFSIPEEKPVATLTGEEMGKMPQNGALRIKILRERAINWYRSNLQGTTVRGADGVEVRFNRTGMKKSTANKSEDLLRAMPALRAIIENGTVKEMPYRSDRKRAFFYAARVELDGVVQRLGVIAIEERDGRRQYDLTKDTGKRSIGSTPNGAGAYSEPGIEASSDAELNLFIVDEEINNNNDMSGNTKKQAALADLQARMQELGIQEKIALRVVDRLGARTAGTFDARWTMDDEKFIRGTISIALEALQASDFTLNHEAIHAMRSLGLFRDAEWAALSRRAQSDFALMRSIKRRYPGLSKDAQIEEAIADMFAGWKRLRNQKGLTAKAFDRILAFMTALSAWAKGRGYISAEDVMRAIDSGAQAGRDSGQAARGGRANSLFDEPEQPKKTMTDKQRAELEARQKQGMARKGGQQGLGDQDSGLFSSERDQGMLFSRADPVDTPEFKRWFGDSKVVDTDGDPMVMYHGTSGDQRGDAFTMFDTYASNYGLMGMGGYFTDNPDVASEYTAKGRGTSPTVYPVFLSIKNPIDMDAAADPDMWTSQFEGIEDYHEGGDNNESWYRAAEDLIAEDGLPKYEGAEIMQDGLRAMGFDGITHIGGGRRKDSATRHRVYVAFDPEQIKSATGNNGDFDPANADIRYSITDVLDLAGTDPTWKGEMADKFERFRMATQDRYITLRKVQRKIERAFGRPIPDNMDPYKGEELVHGRIAERLDQLHDKVIGPMLDDMADAKVSIDEFETYLIARHAPERNAQIAKINKDMPDGGSGMSNIEAAAIMNRVAKSPKGDAIERIAKRVDDLREMTINNQVAYGLISADRADELRATYKFYVPLRGFKETESQTKPDAPNRSGGGINVRGPEGKRAFGRRSKADSPLSYLVMQAEEAISRGETNRVAQEFYELAKASPDEDFWKIQKVQYKRRINPDSGIVEDYVVTQLTAEDGPYTVVAKIDGKERRVTMNKNNPGAARLADAMRRLTDSQLDWVTKNIGVINRWLSAVNTRFSPEFIITNLLRDVQTVAVNLQGLDVDGISKKAAYHYKGAFAASMRGAFDIGEGDWAKWYKEFSMAGAKTAFARIDNIDAIKSNIEKEFAVANSRAGNNKSAILKLKIWGSKAKDVIENLNDGVENSTRLAVYRASRESGLSEKQAASIAKNISVNFNRRGQMGPAMNALYLFYNAGVQGNVRILQAIYHSKKVQAIVGAIVVAGALSDLLNSLVSDDDDDGESFYDKIPAYVKERNIIIMHPDGRNYTPIAMPYGYNAFWETGRILTEIGRRGGDRAAQSGLQLLTTYLGAFNPIGFSWEGRSAQEIFVSAIMPTPLDPFNDIADNVNFMGSPIMPEEKQFGPQDPDAQRFWPGVDKKWKALTDLMTEATGGNSIEAGWLDVSPETVEYLVDTVFGSVGGLADRIISIPEKIASGEATAADFPVVRKFTGEKSKFADKSAFFERIKEVEARVDDARDYLESDNMEEFDRFVDDHERVLSLETQTKEARKMSRQIRKERRGNDGALEKGNINAAEHKENEKILDEAEKGLITEFNRQWVSTVYKSRE